MGELLYRLLNFLKVKATILWSQGKSLIEFTFIQEGTKKPARCGLGYSLVFD
jgi:hypothetical protein